MSDAVDEQVRAWVELYRGEVRLGELLCDRHATGGRLALRFEGPAGSGTMSYAELADRSMRLAGALGGLGVGPGDRVATMLPRGPELLVTLVAVLRLGAVHVPLFTAFGPDAVAYRVEHSGAQLVVVDAGNRAKLGDVLVPVLCVGAAAGSGDVDFARAVDRAPAAVGVPRRGDDLMLLLYTSGTTGRAKGVEIPVWALASFHAYLHYGLDLRPEDRFWNVADPGWGYGLFYGLLGVPLLGQTMLLRDGPFDAREVLDGIVRHEITNFAAVPTVYRSLRAAGVPDEFAGQAQLRAVSSAGEPLNPELLAWSADRLGAAIRDHYGQSELGMTVGFAQHADLRRTPVPGSMGVALPGFRAVVLDEEGREQDAGGQGELAFDVPASPLCWFRGYFDDPQRTRERYRHGPRYYLTGDEVHIDEDGLLFFASRADDVITSSGYRVGPFDVESALLKHKAVVEAAVIGVPDSLRGEAITAFVVTAPHTVCDAQLTAELRGLVRARLATHLYPRHIVYVTELPRTPSGKVQRTVLRERWEQRDMTP